LRVEFAEEHSNCSAMHVLQALRQRTPHVGFIISGLKTLFHYSPLGSILSILIAALSIMEACFKETSARDKTLKILAATLAVILVGAQYVSGKVAEDKATLAQQTATMNLNNALAAQAKNLQAAFASGTVALETQAKKNARNLEGATLGTKQCPEVIADHKS
jgi:hypothetical protein